MTRTALLLAGGVALQPATTGMMAVSLSTIAGRFHSSPASAAGLLVATYVVAAAAAPIAGHLADHLGARRVYLTGLALTAAFSLAAFGAQSVAFLVVVRAGIGLGTAAQFPAAVRLIRARAVATGQPVAPAWAVLTAASQAAAALGPLAGGALDRYVGWWPAFAINVPIAAVVAVLVTRRLSAGPARPPTGSSVRWWTLAADLDVVGALLFCAGLILLLWSMMDASAGPVIRWIAVVAGVAVVATLIGWERRTAHPMLAPGLRTWAVAHLLARNTLVYCAFYVIYFGLPVWLEGAREFAAPLAGAVMMPLASIGAVAALAAGVLVRRRGPRAAMWIGSGLLLAAGGVLGLLSPHSPLVWLVVAAGLLGMPAAPNDVAHQQAIVSAVPTELSATTAGLMRMSQYTAAALGAAVVTIADPATAAGLHRIAVVVLALAVLAVGSTAALTLHERGFHRARHHG